MPAATVELRDGLRTAIEAVRAGGGYVLNNFNLEKAYNPYEILETINTDHPGGKLYLIALNYDEGPNEARSNIAPALVPCQMGFQKQIINQVDITVLDQLVELCEQIRSTVRNYQGTADQFSWLRTDSLKDQGGQNTTPMAFMGLREGNYFESYWTSYFTCTLE